MVKKPLLWSNEQREYVKRHNKDYLVNEIEGFARQGFLYGQALRHIAKGGCHNYTRGNCFENGRTIDAEFESDSACDACIAMLALGMITVKDDDV
jgi:deoxyribodipyrimidine photolyase-like uncharacterized protein